MRLIRSLIIISVFVVNSRASTVTTEANISLRNLFSLDCDMENGIKGRVEGNGRIEVKVYDKLFNMLIYHTLITSSSSSDYSGNDIYHTRESIGVDANYYPASWLGKDIKTAALSIFKVKYGFATDFPQPLFPTEEVPVKIVLEAENAIIDEIKIPGIGVVDSRGGNKLFNPKHFCYDLKNAQHEVTRAWSKVKQPRVDEGCDVIIAAHRGIWGNELGAGHPENSTASIKATKAFTDVLESDIMITQDKELIVSHDYNLKRISNFSGNDHEYLFNMDASELKGLKLRKRNMEVSEYEFLTFADLVDQIKQHGLVLTIDIKDITARSRNGVCIDNCEFDPKTNGEAAKQKRFLSWIEIFKKCIKTAADKNALPYIAFKVPHTYENLKKYVSEDTLSQILFMPVIQPGRTDYLEFTDSWISEGGNRVLAYETNFKSTTDTYLQPIERNGKSYQNFLHYVYECSGLRPGCYPEEPMGPKGIVNRWAEWLIKDLRTDVRGDYYFLMSVPYGRIMVLTTDRPDMWLWINRMYNRMSE